MNNEKIRNWSDNLKRETENALLQCQVDAPDEFLHMKCCDGSFGKIRLKDLITGQLLIEDKKTQCKHLYTTIDELIAAGWVID